MTLRYRDDRCKAIAANVPINSIGMCTSHIVERNAKGIVITGARRS